MKIDVVIPNYNGFDLLAKNLPQVLSVMKGYNMGDILVVDDASNDGDYYKVVELVKNLNKQNKLKITLLRNNKNMGFSSTANVGVKNSSAELVVLLNSDAVPEKGFLEPILSDFKNDSRLFGVGCMDKSIEKKGVILRGRGIGYFKKGLINHSRGEVNKSETFWVSGGSSVVKREIFLKLGGFDPLFNPFYWEDIDLSYRARKSGFNIKFNSKSIVEHRHLEGVIRKHFSETKVKIIAYRNQFIFLWKNISDPSLIISHIFWLPYHVIFAFLRFDIPFFLGFATALMRFPAIMERRSIQKQLYEKQDKDLLN